MEQLGLFEDLIAANNIWDAHGRQNLIARPWQQRYF